MEHPTEQPTAEQLFGAMVRRTREEREWTQEELRRRLAERGITLEKTAMIRLESGKRPIRFNEVVALSRILGLDLATTAFDEADHMSWAEYVETQNELHRLQQRLAELDVELHEVENTRRRLRERQAALSSQEALLQHRLSVAYRYAGLASTASPEYAAQRGEEADRHYETLNGPEFMERVRTLRKQRAEEIAREKANNGE